MSERRNMSSAELMALPVGTILVTHAQSADYPDLPDDSVWQVFKPGKAVLLSHHASETEDLDWFAGKSACGVDWESTVVGVVA